MRILFTGGGTGGHFYPIVAIAQELKQLAKDKRLIDPELFYMAPTPYDEGLLFEQSITYKKIRAGKLRRYFSVLNFFDFFKTGWGILTAVWQVYRLYPDVVFGKGGYASFPVLFAARILRIPVVIHESDSVPGRVNLWAGKFAQRIALSYKEAAKYFPGERVAHTGQPIRKELREPIASGAREFLKIEDGIPVILVLGGSLGSEIINETVIEALPSLVESFVVIHQTGKLNFQSSKTTGETVLYKSQHKDRYKPFDYLSLLAMRMAAGCASVVVSRAGSTIFEIASWGLPSVIIPIEDSNGDHQRENAFAFARAGGCEVIEERNFSSHILESEVRRLADNQDDREKMIRSAKAFDKPDAAKLVAEEILKIALSHEIVS